jgi:hypothetical protein
MNSSQIIEYSTCTEELYYRPLNEIFMAPSSKLFSKINEFHSRFHLHVFLSNSHIRIFKMSF